MKKNIRLIIAVLMLLVFPLRQFAQQPYRQYADDGILLNFHKIDNVDFRAFLLYSLSQDNRFSLIADDEPGLFSISSAPESGITSLSDAFEELYQNIYADFSLLSKMDIYDLLPQWKGNVNPSHFTSITMDIAIRNSRVDNDHCANSNPFCTTNQYTFDAAATSQTADQLEGVTFEDGCIGSSYNPSWYYMRIHEPGKFIIHMEGHDPNTGATRDIDFCIWGPFDDPWSPCVAGLTTSNIIDCCYSADPTEDIYLGYQDDDHEHTTGHGTINYHLPQTGEYYILMITNYSMQDCTITFSKKENSGPGTTDCDILPGNANNTGPYCVGETIDLTVNYQAGGTYQWTGPNGYSSNTQNPTLTNCTLDMAGIYTCVTTVGGETTSGATTVVIYAQPIADFNATSVCVGNATQFTSTSTTDPAGQNIASYQWDFGDGQTSTVQNHTHTYAAAGTYEATLTVSNGNGLCSDEITKTVTVHAMPAPTATANPYSVQFAGVSTLTGNAGVGGSFTYHWEPASMVTDPNSQTTQTVPLTETQVYTLTVTNTEGGCSSTTTVTVSMDGSNLTATATADQYELCEGSSTTIHAIPANGTGSYTFSWNPDNTLSNTSAQNPTVTPNVGSTTYTCVVSDGIIDQTVSVTILVHPNLETDIYKTICSNQTYQFFNQSLHTPGVYDHTIQTQYGCDSTIHLHLDNWDIFETEVEDSFCQGDTYTFYGQQITTGGIYSHTLSTQQGCDSVIRLNLTLNPVQESEFTLTEEETCDSYFWDPKGHVIVSTDHEGNEYTLSGHYHRTYLDQLGCDSLVTMHGQFEYTPDPTAIYPKDFDNPAPHWVVTASEFQINAYDFTFWDNNPLCHWDSIVWQLENPNVSWFIEPDSTTHPVGKNCKLYVLEHVDDTIWFNAKVYNRCAPEGKEKRYWVVCSFYDVDESSISQADFSVVPNPNNGQMMLNFEHLTGKINIRVYDMRGALIDHFETHNGFESSSVTYDMSNRADGLYHFVATGKEGTIAKKVVIQK